MKKPIVITLTEVGETQHNGDVSKGILQVNVDGLPEDWNEMLDGMRKPNVVEMGYMRASMALQGKAVPAMTGAQLQPLNEGTDAIPLPASSNSNIDFN